MKSEDESENKADRKKEKEKMKSEDDSENKADRKKEKRHREEKRDKSAGKS